MKPILLPPRFCVKSKERPLYDPFTHGLNYTVIGREVNLASRLETVSGRGRIIIGETTYRQILRDDPALAATCIEQEPTLPKGFQKPVRNFEVPWRLPGG